MSKTRSEVIAKAIVALCFAGCFLTALPLFAQAAIDAVQTEKIAALDRRMGDVERLVMAVAEKQTYQLGGLAGIYALLGIIGVFNLKLIGKK